MKKGPRDDICACAVGDSRRAHHVRPATPSRCLLVRQGARRSDGGEIVEFPHVLPERTFHSGRPFHPETCRPYGWEHRIATVRGNSAANRLVIAFNATGSFLAMTEMKRRKGT